jgi:hypothetical protein
MGMGLGRGMFDPDSTSSPTLSEGGAGLEGSFQARNFLPSSGSLIAAFGMGASISGGGGGDGKDSLRKFFNLPPDEVLIEEYLCALYKKVLLQGRMYLFSNYVCFYSNVFGYQKKKVIALKNVTIVNKANTLKVVPNAIEIVCNGKCEFFTSFIFPDKAYRTITAAWKECSQYSKIFAAADLDRSDLGDRGAAMTPQISATSSEVAAMLGQVHAVDAGGGGIVIPSGGMCRFTQSIECVLVQTFRPRR